MRFFRILTTSPRANVETAFDKLGIGTNDYVVEKAKPAEVVAILERADAAISFRKPTFSQIGASPTKIAEYLAAGLPVVMSHGVGDMDSVISESKTGVIVSEFTKETYDSAAAALIDLAGREDMASRCRETARRQFDLESVGGARYRAIYQKVLKNNERPTG
jgi:Glycosyltransferase